MSELAELATASKVFLSISNGDENAEENDPNSVTSKKVSLAPFYKSSPDFEDTIIDEYENSKNKVELKKMTLEKDGQKYVGFLVPGIKGKFNLSEDDYKSQKQEIETADSGRADVTFYQYKNNVAVYEALMKLFGNTDKEIILNSNLKDYDYIAPFFYLYLKEDNKYYGLLYPKQVIKIKYKIEIVTRNYQRYNPLGGSYWRSFTPKFTIYEWKARFPLVEELKVLFNHNFLKYSGVGLLTLEEGETEGQINQEYRQGNNFDLPEPIKGDLEVKVDVYTGELTTKNLAFNAADYYLRPEVQSCVNMRTNQYYYSYYDWHGHHWRYVREADIDYYDSNGVCHFGHDSDNKTNGVFSGGLWENNYPDWSNLRFSIEALDGMHKTFNKNMFVSCWTDVEEISANQYHEASYHEYINWFYYNEVKKREEVVVGWTDPYTPIYEWQWVKYKQPKTFWLELVIDY